MTMRNGVVESVLTVTRPVDFKTIRLIADPSLVCVKEITVYSWRLLPKQVGALLERAPRKHLYIVTFNLDTDTCLA